MSTPAPNPLTGSKCSEENKRHFVDLELFNSPIVEPLTKGLTALAICSFATGFLIILVNEGNHGFLDASLLKPRAVLVGALFLFLVVLPVSFTQSRFIPRMDERETGTQRGARVGLSLLDYFSSCWAAWLVASIFFVESPISSVIHIRDGVASTRPDVDWFGFICYFVVLFTVGFNGILAFGKDVRAFNKAPRFWMTYSIVGLFALLLAAFGEWRTPSFRYLMWTILTSALFNSFFRDWRRGQFASFKVVGVIPFLVGSLSLYAAFLFPLIKSTWGGGSPVPALLTLANTTLGPEIQVQVVEATDSGYYVIPAGQTNVTFVPKGAVEVIEFVTRRSY